jgi:hypothetical protein
MKKAASFCLSIGEDEQDHDAGHASLRLVGCGIKQCIGVKFCLEWCVNVHMHMHIRKLIFFIGVHENRLCSK